MLIQVEHLYHDYAGKGQYAVKDVSFHIEKGEIFGFLGPSGAGKSTVQNILIGLLSLQQGEVNYEGKSIRSMDPSFFNRVGVSFEHPNLYGKLTGYENLRYYGGLFAGPTEDPLRLLEMVGLKDAAHRKAAAYSKGMKQRLVFARSLVNRPDILFLDEPTSGLDPATAGRIKELIVRKKEEGCTIFLTTHNMLTADELCDRVAFINDGELVEMDAPRSLKLRYGEKSIRVEYLDGQGTVAADTLFVEQEEDRSRLGKLLASSRLQTVHSQEATLEQIFIRLTGRGLQS